MVKNLIFDLGGVILDINMRNAYDAFYAMGYDGDDDSIKHFDSLYQTGKMTTREFCEGIAKKCNPGTSAEQIAKAWNSICLNVPETKLEKLKELRKTHKVYLLSNTNDLHWDLCCEKWFNASGHNLDDFFDEVFLSQRLGLEKPDPRIFEMVIQKLGVNPAETLFLDDNSHNVAAAAKCGVRGIHVVDCENFDFDRIIE